MRASKIRVFPDWGTPWPVWSDEIAGASPPDLDLTPGLVADLARWVRVWAAHFNGDAQSPQEYWDDTAIGRRWVADGHDLVARLRSELPGVAVEAAFVDSGPAD